MRCIFCLSNGPFNTIEHIIPESLGNTDDILKDAVCDKCQNYFGKEIESYVLSKTPFAFWRVMYRIKTKKGKSPFYNTSLPNNQKGTIPNTHNFNDSRIIMYPTNYEEDTIIEIDIDNEELKNKILSGEKNKINIVLTPLMVVMIGRFLGKIALEFLYKKLGEEVFANKFDSLRKYVRYGTTSDIWPILHCMLKEALNSYEIDEKDNETETCTVYRYGLFECLRYNNYVFLLDMGQERYGIILDEKFPTPEILKALIDYDGNEMEFIWYPLM